MTETITLLIFWLSLASLIYFLIVAGLTVGLWGGIISFGALIGATLLKWAIDHPKIEG